jgi:archaellum biogenesis protein FlaJ (TadC family)
MKLSVRSKASPLLMSLALIGASLILLPLFLAQPVEGALLLVAFSLAFFGALYGLGAVAIERQAETK